MMNTIEAFGIYTYASRVVALANLASTEFTRVKDWLGGKSTKRLAP